MNTIELLDRLAEYLAAGHPAVWVTVLATRGSTPRETGASMLVCASGNTGTIGGGRLEQRATVIALALLDACSADACPPRRIERFPLGARLGQCCGGEVQLAFDAVIPAHRAWVDNARNANREGGDRCSVLDAHLPRAVAWAGHEPQVALFGAGHVGRALADLLIRLPFRLTWLDTREAAFAHATDWPPSRLRCVVTDTPQEEVATLPGDSAAVVLTHSHALDLEIVDAWLTRGDFRFLGLIGSRSKRVRFEHQLRLRGHPTESIARLICPIGIRGVRGKEPEVIAIAVAAQLLALRDRREAPQK